jgi:hypothetical protein
MAGGGLTCCGRGCYERLDEDGKVGRVKTALSALKARETHKAPTLSDVSGESP